MREVPDEWNGGPEGVGGDRKKLRVEEGEIKTWEEEKAVKKSCE